MNQFDIRKKIEEIKRNTDVNTLKSTDEMLREKIEQNRRKKIDYENRTFELDGRIYTFDELYSIYLENENFVGKTLNKENVEKYFQVAALMKELYKKNGNFTNININKPNRNSKIVCFDLDYESCLTLSRNELRIFAQIMSLCDCCTFSTNQKGTRIGLIIADI